MRGSIVLLLFIMFALIANIVAYSVSEDYRFFIKKIKYKQDVVYDDSVGIDDFTRVVLVEEGDKSSSGDLDTDTVIISKEGFTFLDAIGREGKTILEDEAIPELSTHESHVLELLKDSFVLTENITTTSLFDITTEYPDEYREYANKHLSLYMFSTKEYDEVYDIFEVLKFDLPYTINETNSFGTKSFFINLDGVYADGKVRIIFQYKNQAFGLKIKKDSYNAVKEILQELNT